MKLTKWISMMIVFVLLLSLMAVGVSAEDSKIEAELAERLETMEDDEAVPVSVYLINPPALDEVSIPALIAEKYGITTINADTIDDYYMYERIERTAIFQPFFEEFFEDYRDGIVEKQFVPSCSNFCILDVTKSTIYEMANDDRVKEIAYSDNAIQEVDAIESSPEVIGDITGNGSLDMKDVLLTRKLIAGVLPSDRAFTEEKADVNLDGTVDMKDVLLMRFLLIGAAAQG